MPGIRGPGGIQLKRQATIESDERRGKILDFIRLAGRDFKTPSLPLTSSLWTQGRIGRRAYSARGRIAKDPQGHVEDVDAEVDQWTSARHLLRCEPGAQTGNP